MKTGLVMEGGAMRGLFTAGVLDVMMEQGLADFDGAIGVSAGACFGCNIKSRQQGRSYRYNLRFCKDWRYASVRSLRETGDFFGSEFCYKRIPLELDPFDTKTFTENPMEFYVVATDLVTGKPVYHKLYDGLNSDLKWIQASASMPLAAKTIEIGRWKLLDGGVADSIPLQFLENKGYDKNVVILTQPRGFVKKPSKALPAVRVAYREYPKFVRKMETRHIHYNEETDYVMEREREGACFVICPSESLPINHISHEPMEIVETYEAGRAAAWDRLEEMRGFLGR
ncbi:MAG: patatin family protein [Lachnospiraceae bacterium]|nr:patatin family protein [Lachnospiraceae bacterium]